jgi:HK97 family phage major capsid protein
MNVKELGAQLAAKRTELNEAFKGYPDIPAERVETIRQLNDEATDLAKKYEGAVALEEMKGRNDAAIKEYERPANGSALPTPHYKGGRQEQEQKDLGAHLRESASYEAFRNGQAKTAVIDLPGADFKTLLALTDYNNQPTRLPEIVMPAQETRTIADLMLQGRTSNNTITYMEETTFTNSAAAVAEGGTKPESALGFTERTENVRKIATWIPATSELLADVPMMESYIRGRLGFMIERTEEAQILSGNGTAPNISGILDRPTIQTQAKGSDPTPDAVYKAMTKIRTIAFAEPTAAIFHPNDWQDIRLLRTADGIYIWGSPADAGPERIWGLTVRQTTAMTENTALVGAFRPHAQIFRREGLTITISTEHSTYFVENKVAILAESRLALAVYRPTAFCTVTGI